MSVQWNDVELGEDFFDRMRARLSSGDVPDIIIGKAQDVEGFTNAGILSPVKIKDTDIFYEEAADTVKSGSVLYGLPYNAWYQGVFTIKIFLKNMISVFRRPKRDMEKTVQRSGRERNNAFCRTLYGKLENRKFIYAVNDREYFYGFA